MIFLRIGAWAMGILALLSLGVLAVGFVLPSTWEAEAEILIEAPVDSIHPRVTAASAWLDWTPGPDTGVESFGPPQGAGSGYRWDDPGYGKGEFVLTEVSLGSSPQNGVPAGAPADTPGAYVRYEVEVEGGSIRIEGSMTLAHEPDGTRVFWKEVGDFGWNPMLGYLSGRMAELQGEQLARSLLALKMLVEEGGETAEVSPGQVAGPP
ncbi:MAG: hypothetical protein EA350_10390 [Gemmatimonadales bacterium]|nr:MAG: hypothetical protein EA350_10390 [Gemmatimonadales bacterium]